MLLIQLLFLQIVVDVSNCKKALPHRRELRGSDPPKGVMRPWAALHHQVGKQESQASDRPACKDEAAPDDRCTKSVANGANKRESAQPYSCLGFVGKADQSRLQPASIQR